MPTKKKESEDKIAIRQFRDKSSNFWVGYLHYCLNEQNEIEFVCGGIDTEEHREVLRNYIKRNKKTYQPREIVAEEVQYTAIIPIGKYKGENISDVFYKDKKYLKWMIDNYSFSPQQKDLEEQIKLILK